MKICCTSDLHGSLPEIPDCELLLIGGDLCGPSAIHLQAAYLQNQFLKWVEELVGRKITVVAVAGNHDFIFEKNVDLVGEIFKDYPDEFFYLQNAEKRFYINDTDSLGIFGTPGSLPFGNWAFNYTEKTIAWSLRDVTDITDIIISHGPPFRYGDLVPDGDFNWKTQSLVGIHVGSKALLEKVDEIKPKLVIFGHIHSGYGIYKRGDTTLVNCSLMNEQYKPIQLPILIDL